PEGFFATPMTPGFEKMPRYDHLYWEFELEGDGNSCVPQNGFAPLSISVEALKGNVVSWSLAGNTVGSGVATSSKMIDASVRKVTAGKTELYVVMEPSDIESSGICMEAQAQVQLKGSLSMYTPPTWCEAQDYCCGCDGCDASEQGTCSSFIENCDPAPGTIPDHHGSTSVEYGYLGSCQGAKPLCPVSVKLENKECYCGGQTKLNQASADRCCQKIGPSGQIVPGEVELGYGSCAIGSRNCESIPAGGYVQVNNACYQCDNQGRIIPAESQKYCTYVDSAFKCNALLSAAQQHGDAVHGGYFCTSSYSSFYCPSQGGNAKEMTCGNGNCNKQTGKCEGITPSPQQGLPLSPSKLQVPLIDQRIPYPGEIAPQNSCGPAALAMVLEYLGILSPNSGKADVIKRAQDLGRNYDPHCSAAGNPVCISPDDLTAVAKSYNAPVNSGEGWSLAQVQSALVQGNPVIMDGRYYDGGPVGHFVVVTGTRNNADGTPVVIYNNPWGGREQEMPASEFFDKCKSPVDKGDPLKPEGHSCWGAAIGNT
ncbi:hypothetical protein COY95_02860, partial [Candidatus Woesearchaeota archaeon CG_4_10_14_0_8_um_filter_47_5]